MATNYSNWVMTPKFVQAEQAAANSGNQIEWTRFVTSDDRLQFNDLSGLTDTILETINQKQITSISAVKVVNSAVTVTGVISSVGNEADYYINTILVVASYNGQEFLAGAAIAQNQAMRMPQEDSNEYTEFTIRPQITISSAEIISTKTDPIAAATNESVDAKVETLQKQLDDIKSVNDSQNDAINGKVSKTVNETIDGIKTFTKTIVGSITGSSTSATGNAATATKLLNPITIALSGDIVGSAQNFDGTENKNIVTTFSTASGSASSATYSGLMSIRKRGALATLRVAGLARNDTNNSTNSFDELILTVPNGWQPLTENVGQFYSGEGSGKLRMGFVHLYVDGTIKITSFFSSHDEAYTSFRPYWNGQITYLLKG